MAEDLFAEWLAECERLLGRVLRKFPSAEHAIVLPVVAEKAIRPYHYFEQEKKREALERGGGSGHGESVVGETGKSGEPHTRQLAAETSAAPQTEVKTEGKTEYVQVRVTNTKREHASVMKGWYLRWEPIQMHWWGKVKKAEFETFSTRCKEIGATVKVIEG